MKKIALGAAIGVFGFGLGISMPLRAQDGIRCTPDQIEDVRADITKLRADLAKVELDPGEAIRRYFRAQSK